MNCVWYVRGEPDLDGDLPTLFATKLDAEAYARALFPAEPTPWRYARVMYRPVHARVAVCSANDIKE